ncbi:MAG TPA: type III secretion system export apparatus subunit SctS [Thermoanaerobaculia bacterium]|nr:type III secretion system export apparatus subunit SctS [Thermoanaerobaculia bacterium]
MGNTEQFLYLSRQAMMLVVLVSAPPIVAALAVGLTLAILQALTQIQEQTLQTAARLVVVFAVLIFAGYWMALQVLAFAVNIFNNFGTWVS